MRSRYSSRSRTATRDLSDLVEMLNSGDLKESDVLLSEENDPDEEINVVLCYDDSGYGAQPNMLGDIFLYTDISVEEALSNATDWVIENGGKELEELYTEALDEIMAAEEIDSGDEDALLDAEQQAQDQAMERMSESVMYVEWTTTWGEFEEALDQVTNEKNLAKI